jgi:predicted transport protein
MAIFEIDKGKAKRVRLSDFKLEKDLQRLVEDNLETIFNCRLIATEFSTGNIHSGRIDTLAISEDNNPVIIEYKKVASSDLINQSLYYLHWIKDHKGDFQIAANKALGKNVDVDWSDIRVICLAPEYKKYDLHAVQVMGANIELWQYKTYENGILNIEEVYKRTATITSSNQEINDLNGKNPVMVEAGRKAALTRRTATYTLEEHFEGLNEDMQELFETIRDYIIGLDGSIEEAPKKKYVAYKTSQNFACLQASKNRIILYLKLDPSQIVPIPKQGRDVREIGHFGTGDFELTIKDLKDFEETKYLINEAYKNIGG